MGTDTKIQWCHHTWNPWQGCIKVSSGCTNCYMYTDKKRYGQDPAVVVRSKRPTFRRPLRGGAGWGNVKEYNWVSGERVFVCSWSDFFIEQADPWRTEAWDIIRERKDLTFIILTKRPERIRECLPDDWGDGWPHVWLGVSVEDQAAANKRIPPLLRTLATVRFLSVEPLLGPVDLNEWMPEWTCYTCGHAGDSTDDEHCPGCGTQSGDGFGHAENDPDFVGIDWIIVGAESGPGARPCDLVWMQQIVKQCRAADVSVFVKQIGSNPVMSGGTIKMADGKRKELGTRGVIKGNYKGDDMEYWPQDLRVREFPHVG